MSAITPTQSQFSQSLSVSSEQNIVETTRNGFQVIDDAIEVEDPESSTLIDVLLFDPDDDAQSASEILITEEIMEPPVHTIDYDYGPTANSVMVVNKQRAAPSISLEVNMAEPDGNEFQVTDYVAEIEEPEFYVNPESSTVVDVHIFDNTDAEQSVSEILIKEEVTPVFTIDHDYGPTPSEVVVDKSMDTVVNVDRNSSQVFVGKVQSSIRPNLNLLVPFNPAAQQLNDKNNSNSNDFYDTFVEKLKHYCSSDLLEDLNTSTFDSQKVYTTHPGESLFNMFKNGLESNLMVRDKLFHSILYCKITALSTPDLLEAFSTLSYSSCKNYKTHVGFLLARLVHDEKPKKTTAKDILPLVPPGVFKKTNRKRRLDPDFPSSNEYKTEQTEILRLKAEKEIELKSRKIMRDNIRDRKMECNDYITECTSLKIKVSNKLKHYQNQRLQSQKNSSEREKLDELIEQSAMDKKSCQKRIAEVRKYLRDLTPSRKNKPLTVVPEANIYQIVHEWSQLPKEN